MNFDFDTYFLNLVIVPLIFAFFGLVVLLSNITKHYRNRPTQSDIKYSWMTRRMISSIGTFIFCIILSLWIGKFSLVLDNENKTETISGEILSIEEAEPRAKIKFEGEYTYQKHITINGEEYYIMTIGDFEIGDNVSIVYLPHSKIILSIQEEE